MSGMIGQGIKTSKQKSIEWYTPQWIFDALGLIFDVDPASPLGIETAVPALQKYTVEDNGLQMTWSGLVWLNPPYDKTIASWMDKMDFHNNGIALVFSRTDSAWFQKALRHATGILFLSGRINFVPGPENQHKKSRCGAGSAMFSYGDECFPTLRKMSSYGTFFDNYHKENPS